MVWKACLACLWKACLACLEGLSSWLEGWCWLGGRLAVESHTHDALGRSADKRERQWDKSQTVKVRLVIHHVFSFV